MAMLTFKNLSSVLRTADFNHPIFEAYRIRKIELTEYQTVLKIEDLTILIEHGETNLNVGLVKWLKETRKPLQEKEVVKVDETFYRIQANMVLLTPEQEKEFEKTYRQPLKQFKKAIKDYEVWAKKQQKVAIRQARKVELPTE